MYKSIYAIYVEPKFYSYKCYFSSVAGATESEESVPSGLTVVPHINRKGRIHTGGLFHWATRWSINPAWFLWVSSDTAAAHRFLLTATGSPRLVELAAMTRRSFQVLPPRPATKKKLWHIHGEHTYLCSDIIKKERGWGGRVDVLMELCPLRELRRLSTEPPAFSLGFSRESMSGWGDWGEPGAPSGLDCRRQTEGEKKHRRLIKA